MGGGPVAKVLGGLQPLQPTEPRCIQNIIMCDSLNYGLEETTWKSFRLEETTRKSFPATPSLFFDGESETTQANGRDMEEPLYPAIFYSHRTRKSGRPHFWLLPRPFA